MGKCELSCQIARLTFNALFRCAFRRENRMVRRDVSQLIAEDGGNGTCQVQHGFLAVEVEVVT